MGYIRPILDRVIVLMDDAESTTVTGLHVPQSAREQPMWGEVVAVSDAVAKRGDVRVGDRVYVDWWTGADIVVDGRTMRWVDESAIEIVVEQ